jgi:hypothetical protein
MSSNNSGDSRIIPLNDDGREGKASSEGMASVNVSSPYLTTERWAPVTSLEVPSYLAGLSDDHLNAFRTHVSAQERKLMELFNLYQLTHAELGEIRKWLKDQRPLTIQQAMDKVIASVGSQAPGVLLAIYSMEGCKIPLQRESNFYQLIRCLFTLAGAELVMMGRKGKDMKELPVFSFHELHVCAMAFSSAVRDGAIPPYLNAVSLRVKPTGLRLGTGINKERWFLDRTTFKKRMNCLADVQLLSMDIVELTDEIFIR